MLDTSPEASGLLRKCQDLGVTLVAHTPLQQGVLTGMHFVPDAEELLLCSHQDNASAVQASRQCICRAISMLKRDYPIRQDVHCCVHCKTSQALSLYCSLQQIISGRLERLATVLSTMQH